MKCPHTAVNAGAGGPNIFQNAKHQAALIDFEILPPIAPPNTINLCQNQSALLLMTAHGPGWEVKNQDIMISL